MRGGVRSGAGASGEQVKETAMFVTSQGVGYPGRRLLTTYYLLLTTYFYLILMEFRGVGYPGRRVANQLVRSWQSCCTHWHLQTPFPAIFSISPPTCLDTVLLVNRYWSPSLEGGRLRPNINQKQSICQITCRQMLGMSFSQNQKSQRDLHVSFGNVFSNCMFDIHGSLLNMWF